MTTLTIPMAEERLTELKERAEQVGISPEELARATLDEWLGQPKPDFREAADKVFRRYTELYKRLA